MIKVCLCFLVFAGIAFGLKDCYYNGATYATGAKFKSSDGCNTCFCNNGAVGCTLKLCLPDTGFPCKYNNTIHQSGDSFKSTDGCNTCTCSYGLVSCTEMACIKPTGVFSPDGSPEH